MAILIENMSMPEDCDNCPFFEDRYDYPTCAVTGYSKGYRWAPFNQRMPDCPLKEVVDELKYLKSLYNIETK